MKIKLDENIPYRLAEPLRKLGHDVDTVILEGLNGKPDEIVWSQAQSSGRFLITQDLDFSNINRYAPGTHSGIMIVRLRDPGRMNLFRRILFAFQSEEVEKWNGYFLVLTDQKLRIQRPKS